MSDGPSRQQMSSPTFKALGVTTGQIQATLITALLLFVLGLFVLSRLGGTNSTAANNALILGVGPLLIGLLLALLIKINAMHIQFNARMDELLVETRKSGHAEGVQQEREERAARDSAAHIAAPTRGQDA